MKRMARNKLTVTQVKAKTSPGRVGDGDGLYFHVAPGGSRSWVFVFIRQGRRRELGLGAFGSGTGQVSLADARIKAEEIRAILGRGGDPFTEMAERKAKPERRTFAEAASAFLETKEGTWRNQKHHDQWVMTLGDAYCSSLRKKMVDEIAAEDILAVIEPVWATKHETASRLRGRIEKVLDFAKVKQWRSGENPARWKGHLEHSLQKPTDKLSRGHHAALPYADVPDFLAKLAGIRGVGALALTFLIHTAARTGEVIGATWDEIDLKAGVWTVPAERMKAGREHRVPLTPSALAVLERMRELRLNQYLFPGSKKGTHISNMTMTKVLRDMQIEATSHGFRSSFRDWAHEQTNFPGELAEAALSHIVGDETERAYKRGDALSKRRKLMDSWAKYATSKNGK